MAATYNNNVSESNITSTDDGAMMCKETTFWLQRQLLSSERGRLGRKISLLVRASVLLLEVELATENLQ